MDGGKKDRKIGREKCNRKGGWRERRKIGMEDVGKGDKKDGGK